MISLLTQKGEPSSHNHSTNHEVSTARITSRRPPRRYVRPAHRESHEAMYGHPYSSGRRTYLDPGIPGRASELLQRIQIQLAENIMKTTSLIAVMCLLALNVKADTQEQLAACRQQIDSLDQRIVDLIQQRARVVKEVGEIKREAHLPVTVPSREQQVVEKAQALAQAGPLPAEAVGRIYQKLVEEMRNWETKLDATTP
jgi:chorismate mutase